MPRLQQQQQPTKQVKESRARTRLKSSSFMTALGLKWSSLDLTLSMLHGELACVGLEMIHDAPNVLAAIHLIYMYLWLHGDWWIGLGGMAAVACRTFLPGSSASLAHRRCSVVYFLWAVICGLLRIFFGDWKVIRSVASWANISTSLDDMIKEVSRVSRCLKPSTTWMPMYLLREIKGGISRRFNEYTKQ